MKRIMFVSLACLLAVLLTSCNSNTPRSVAERALDCAIKQDVRGYMDCVYFAEKDQQQKEGYIQMLEEKVKKSPDEGKKMKGYKFLEEEIDEEAGKAKLTYELTYSDGTTKKETYNLIRDEEGKWWMKLQK